MQFSCISTSGTSDIGFQPLLVTNVIKALNAFIRKGALKQPLLKIVVLGNGSAD